jgi:hypothetical protein
MHLYGWIGLGIAAREKHVFTLPGDRTTCRRESKTYYQSPSHAGPRRGVLKQHRQLSTGMSINNQRQAQTPRTGFAHLVPIKLLRLVTITRLTGARSSTIATIIQHSAKNLHDNSHQESHIFRAKRGYLTLFRDLVSFLGKVIHFVFLQNFYRRDQITMRGCRRCGMISLTTESLSSNLPQARKKKSEKCAKKLACFS